MWRRSVLLGLLLSAAQQAIALSLSPTRIVINHNEAASFSVRLADVPAPSALEVTVLERFPGGETRPAAPGDIMAFPPQMIVKPGEAFRVDISVTGSLAVHQSRSYYIRIDELRIGEAEPAGGAPNREISLLTTYLMPLHVLGGHAPHLAAGSAETARGAITLENTGKGAALLSLCTFSRDGGSGEERVLSGREVAAFLARDAILPGERLTLQAAGEDEDMAAWLAAGGPAQIACESP